MIQRAVPKDANAITELIKALLDELNGIPVEWDLNEQQALCGAMIEQGDYVVFHTTDDNGQCVGLITMSEAQALYAGGRFGVVHELYVLPSNRSQQQGRALIQKALEFAREKGWSRLEVGAPAYPQWARTKAFYLREGFEEVGPRLKYKL